MWRCCQLKGAHTIENPAKTSPTKTWILYGSSKFPIVTELTANRDWAGLCQECIVHRRSGSLVHSPRIPLHGGNLLLAHEPGHAIRSSLSWSYLDVGCERTRQRTAQCIRYILKRKESVRVQIFTHRDHIYKVLHMSPIDVLPSR